MICKAYKCPNGLVPMTSDTQLERLYETKDVAEYLGLSTRTVKRFIATGKLRVRRFGRAVRIAENDFKKFASEGTCPQTTVTGLDDSSSVRIKNTAPTTSAGTTLPIDRRMVFQLAKQMSSRRGAPSLSTL